MKFTKKYPSQSKERTEAINAHIEYAAMMADKLLAAHIDGGGKAQERRTVVGRNGERREYIHFVWNDFFHHEMDLYRAEIDREMA